jgi:hypothetical protein
MNREMRRASEKEGRRLQKMPWNQFKNITEEAIKKHKTLNPESNFAPTLVWQNNKYIVQVFHGVERKGKKYIKAMVRRSDSQPILSWTDLFRIKNELFGEECEAIQFLPKKSELTDVANLYWIWVEDV